MIKITRDRDFHDDIESVIEINKGEEASFYSPGYADSCYLDITVNIDGAYIEDYDNNKNYYVEFSVFLEGDDYKCYDCNGLEALWWLEDRLEDEDAITPPQNILDAFDKWLRSDYYKVVSEQEIKNHEEYYDGPDSYEDWDEMRFGYSRRH